MSRQTMNTMVAIVIAGFLLSGLLFSPTGVDRAETEAVPTVAATTSTGAGAAVIEAEAMSNAGSLKDSSLSAAEAANRETDQMLEVVDEEVVDKEFEAFLAGLANASPANLRKEALTHPDPEAREVAVYYLSEKVDSDQMPEVVKTLGETLKDSDESVRIAAVDAFRDINEKVADKASTFEPLTDTTLYDDSAEVREQALQVLVYYHGEKAMPVVRQALADPSADVTDMANLLIEDYEAGDFSGDDESFAGEDELGE